MRHSIAAALLTAALTSGCFLSPTGVNKAASPALVPDGDKKVAVSFTIPAGTSATKVSFQIKDQEGTVKGTPVIDDSTEATRKATLDATDLSPGVYMVEVIADDNAEAPLAKLSLVVKGNPIAAESGDGAQAPAEGG